MASKLNEISITEYAEIGGFVTHWLNTRRSAAEIKLGSQSVKIELHSTPPGSRGISYWEVIWTDSEGEHHWLVKKYQKLGTAIRDAKRLLVDQLPCHQELVENGRMYYENERHVEL